MIGYKNETREPLMIHLVMLHEDKIDGRNHPSFHACSGFLSIIIITIFHQIDEKNNL